MNSAVNSAVNDDDRGNLRAVGLLVHHDGHVLLRNTDGAWDLFAGARDSGESAVDAALRAAAEECAVAAAVTVHGVLHEDDGPAFDTVVGTVPAQSRAEPAAWVPVEAVADHDLFPPFAASWPRLRPRLLRPVLVVDVANVMGSRADGWWRDRAGAAARLRDQVGRLDGVAGMAPFDVAFPEKVLVVEGKARGVGAGATATRVVAAHGNGDDEIVATVARTVAEPDVVCLVVTADRELKARCRAAGAEVAGPRWLLDQL